jgi:D-sedoheptulose 7-phosphate isomerase
MPTSDHERLAAQRIEESLAAVRGLLEEEALRTLSALADVVVSGLRDGGKLLVFGNGGSATQAQHLAAELVGRLRLDRRPLPAVSLVDGVAGLTAIANDYSYDDVFARQLEALGQEGDVALALSTSGHSPNVLAAVRVARERGLRALAMTGPDASPLADAVDVCLRAPGAETTRVQECHVLAAHILCEIVERELT